MCNRVQYFKHIQHPLNEAACPLVSAAYMPSEGISEGIYKLMRVH